MDPGKSSLEGGEICEICWANTSLGVLCISTGLCQAANLRYSKTLTWKLCKQNGRLCSLTNTAALLHSLCSATGSFLTVCICLLSVHRECPYLRPVVPQGDSHLCSLTVLTFACSGQPDGGCAAAASARWTWITADLHEASVWIVTTVK